MNQPFLPSLESEQRDPELSQWYTPPWLAERIWAWAWNPSVRKVLEPSAGSGSLMAPAVASGAEVHCCEFDPTKVEALKARFPSVDVSYGDFLFANRLRGYFDLALMNPPYERGQDVQHIEHAFEFAPRVVALVLHSILFSQERKAFWERVEIRRGVRLSRRPKFGERGGERDFVVLDLALRQHANGPSTETWEWWS